MYTQKIAAGQLRIADILLGDSREEIGNGRGTLVKAVRAEPDTVRVLTQVGAFEFTPDETVTVQARGA